MVNEELITVTDDEIVRTTEKADDLWQRAKRAMQEWWIATLIRQQPPTFTRKLPKLCRRLSFNPSVLLEEERRDTYYVGVFESARNTLIFVANVHDESLPKPEISSDASAVLFLGDGDSWQGYALPSLKEDDCRLEFPLLETERLWLRACWAEARMQGQLVT